ncbi:uncharacterized protein BDW43DRAFT_302806 [Aspergillus alliaceus]|uniref:uncharacterized protein n=1 Tax=Petromyces alliaceus TaxID=209559 RepID=UPI0012A50860|nr:uncharacterized protein BDW43DRAFT_302806 [Aspergillus alliaceus]KAB8229847.1 hypothetical protein BDW43DRAFT_302806 [Aspergillus alliaceus]
MQRNPNHKYIYLALSATFLLASTWTLFDAITFHPTDAQCVQRMFSWSPATDIIEYKWTLFPKFGFLAHSTWFDAPVPERQAAWDEFLPIKADNVLGLPEVFVQLECLNLLRLHAQTDETDSSHLSSFHGTQKDVYHRVEQCFDRLRTSLLCWSDIVPVLQEFEDDRLHTHVVKYDFATKHKCRNFEDIRDWTLRNGVKGVEMDNAWWGGFD